MLAFLRDHNDSQSVIDIFKRLYFELRPDRFCTLFKVCLANNGTEFSSPKAVEYDRQGNLRTHIFYVIRVLPIRRRISVSWMDHINSTAGKVLE